MKLKLKKLQSAVDRAKGKRDREIRSRDLLQNSIRKRQDSPDDDLILELEEDEELQDLIDEAIDAVSRRPTVSPISVV